MFVIDQSKTYKWPVAVRYPVDGGKVEEQTFTAVFRRIPQDDMSKMLQDKAMSFKDFCRRVLAGWEGVSADGKSDMPFTPANLEEFLDVPLVATSIVDAYVGSLAKAREKN